MGILPKVNATPHMLKSSQSRNTCPARVGWALLWMGLCVCGQARAQESVSGQNAYLGASLGQLFTGKLTAPGPYPFVEMKGGYLFSSAFSAQMNLGIGFTKVSGSEASTLNDATMMVGTLLVGLIYTPRLSQTLELHLGGLFGVWFTALWGKDLMGTVSGSVTKYIERVPISYGALAGCVWNLSSRWAFSLEARFNLAMIEFGSESYNAGGLSVYLGFLYRIRAEGT
jgi:hypothetical protein